MIIYLITNKLNSKIYVGQTKTNEKSYYGSGNIIKRAIRKYGKENFEKVILEECDTIDELNNQEQFWISYFRYIGAALYNIAIGGLGHSSHTPWNKGKKLSKEHVAKLKKSHEGKVSSALGYVWTEEQRENISKRRKGRQAWNKGKKCPQLAKCGKDNPMYGKTPWNYGKQLTDSHKENLRKPKTKNKWQSKEL